MQPRQRAVLVLIGFCLLAAGVVAAIGYLLVADNKSAAATLVGTVVALLVAAVQGIKWLWSHWVGLPSVEVGRPLTAVVAVIVVAAAVVAGRAALGGDDDADADVPLTRVDAVVGSEKRSFFADPRVSEVFEARGLDVQVDERGSGSMASLETDLSGYDLAFPASVPTALGIQDRYGIADVDTFTPFESPMVVASFTPAVEALEAEGLARAEADGTWTFDMARFVAFSAGPAEATTWGRLGLDGYPPDRPVLVRTTDPSASNSGAMYLAVVHRVATELAEQGQLPAPQPVVSDLFADQGDLPATTETMFEAYETRGLEFAPLVFAYEAEFVERALRDGGDQLRDDGLALLYPTPTVVTKHTVVPFTDDGARVGELLQSDPRLQELAAEHGFRTSSGDFGALVDDVVPGVRVDIAAEDTIDPPSSDEMAALLAGLPDQYRDGAASAVAGE